MTKPRVLRLYLVRHALSAANLDKSVNGNLPDHAVPLAPDGPRQADAAGLFLAEQIGKHGGRTRVLCSPYRRTRSTAACIRAELEDGGVVHDYREDIALREIGFGLFDGVPDADLAAEFPREYAHYQKHMRLEGGPAVEPTYAPAGEFWAKMPMGESRAEVADRVKQCFGTILRDSDPSRGSPVENFVVVSHGVTLRAFVMQWMHHPYEWYGQQRNPANASVQLISTAGPGEPAGVRYTHATVYAGFAHARATPQQRREQGVVL